ncbi:hypothetical protein AB0P16_15010 [Dietzia maris]|uniref:hypothetical protein n=1 Tax=Dietzia maris TaxID=37915 RepID=UPI00343429CD
MRILSGVAAWLLRGGIVRWGAVLLAFVVVASLVRPFMGAATDWVFALIVVLGLLVIIFRVMLSRGRRRR